MLFDRKGRKLALTSSGRALYEEIGPLIAELDSIARKHRTPQAREELRVSVQPFFASELFVPRLPEFSERHPDLDLLVDTSDESAQRVPANADVSIRLFRQRPEGDADLLLPLRLQPAGAPSFVDALTIENKRIVSDFPLLVHETTPTAWADWERVSGITLPKGKRIVRLDSMIAVARAAERGMGAALIPVPLANEWFAAGTLVPLFEITLVADGGYYLVCSEAPRSRRAVRMLRDWILDSFKEPGRSAERGS